jgi:hypothetical protein
MSPVGSSDSESSLSDLSDDEDRKNEPGTSDSPLTDEEVSQFEEEAHKPQAEKMQLRSSTRAKAVAVTSRPKVMTAREKKEAGRRKKHEQR